MQPPLLPAEALQRVLRRARTDGIGVLILATFFALSSAALGDFPSAVVWLLVAGAGAVELHGAVLLQGVEPRGLNWLVASQLLFLGVVLAYCAQRLTHYDPAVMREALTEDMKASLREANYPEEDFLRTVYLSTYAAMAGTALLYKTGLAIYFQRRRAAVTAALETES